VWLILIMMEGKAPEPEGGTRSTRANLPQASTFITQPENRISYWLNWEGERHMI
jgi:hypothetical protein